MPKIVKDPISPISVGLRRAEREFIERAGTGNNIGAKLRSVLRRCMETFDNVKDMAGAVLLYHEGNGEKVWADNPPFPVRKKDGWGSIEKAAAASPVQHVTQVLENKAEGTVEVWVAPSYKLNDCDACRRRVLEVMRG